MNCTNCGNALRSELKFCPQCGTPAPQPAPYTPPAEPLRTSWEPQMHGRGASPFPPAAAPPRRKSRAGKILLVVFGVFLLLAGGAAVAVYYGVRYYSSSVKSSEPYRVAEKELRENPLAAGALGDIRSTGFPIGSSGTEADGSGHAVYAMSVEGTKDSGQYVAVLTGAAGEWKVKSAILRKSNGEVVTLVGDSDGEASKIAGESGPPPPPAPPGPGGGGRVNVPGAIKGGALDDEATSKPDPTYPRVAQAARAGGEVVVEVTVDEGGKVIMASAVSGHPLLRAAAVAAARQAEFEPTVSGGKPVKVVGTLTYEFAPQ